ncbi:MAG: peptide ABC transporter substrate-binding protein, partial [Anaerolineae bacterium]|nr:peptide ABC transporter substrate-binding protein [Anaerolineae bacterium]
MNHFKRMSAVLMLALVAVLAMGVMVPVMAQDAAPVGECGAEGYTGNFKSIEAVDELTVKFTLCTPDPAFPSKVAFSAFQIAPSEHLTATNGGGPELFQNPVGTGPYKLDTWTQGSEIVMTRNEDYWGDKALEPTLIFRWNADSTARLTELQAGTADGIDNVGPGDFPVVEGDANLALYTREGLNVFYLGFNNTVAPFDNVMVRQAIAYALDKERIVANFYPPGSSAATQFMPSAIATGFTPEVEPFAVDLDMAKQLLADSGVALPIEVTLNYRDVVRGYLPTPGVVATDIQAQLAEIGINVTIEVMESGSFLDAANAGQLGFYMLGWGADYPDATNFLDYHFGEGASPQFGDKFAEITAPLKEAAQLADPAARNAIYVGANTAIRDLVPMIPIAHGGSAVAYRAAITGNPHSSPLGNEAFSV